MITFQVSYRIAVSVFVSYEYEQPVCDQETANLVSLFIHEAQRRIKLCLATVWM